ncbi:hypothetical protein TNCV_3550741 [Trichonephila clavipes]|nr:hypothetical protein TNCV_3550741 [Trichonephila clavipes]
MPSQRELAFTSRREQLESVSSTRERSVDICSRLLPLNERLYLAPSASVRNDLSADVNNQIANDFYKSVNIVHICMSMNCPVCLGNKSTKDQISVIT